MGQTATVKSVMPLTWVVGAGGLLGRHVAGSLVGRGERFEAVPVPWEQPRSARRVLRDNATNLVDRAALGDRPWRMLWCAGAGVTGATVDTLDREVEALRAALTGLGPGRPGSVFLASSVGGVYAGNPSPPFTEYSEPAPLAAYGRAKLQAERMVTQWAHANNHSALIGRITNLFGPGQNLDKPQGLVSQLCANHVRRLPSSIWVSLDTIRDYLYVQDAADLILDAMDRLALESGVVVKILASGQPMSISAVLGEIKRVFGRRVDVLIGTSPTSKYQVRDLGVVSRVWPEIDQRRLTPFAVGVQQTALDLQLRFSLASLPSARRW